MTSPTNEQQRVDVLAVMDGAAEWRGDFMGDWVSAAELKSARADVAELIEAAKDVDVLRGADLRDCPVKIKNIHSAVYAAASKPDALNMSEWHTCDTTHCRAGWVVALAGEGGRALEWAYGTPAAAALIYMASDPTLERVPDFYCGNSEALDDMRRLAEAERAA